MGKNYVLSTPPIISKKPYEYGVESYVCPIQVPYSIKGETLCTRKKEKEKKRKYSIL
jgi:hypothetical protein